MERTPLSGEMAEDRSFSGLIDRGLSKSMDLSFPERSDVVHSDKDEPDAQAIFRPILSRPSGDGESSSPLLPRSDLKGGTGSPHLNDLHKLSLCFFFVFLSYGAIQNLESSLNQDQGLGSISLGVLYLSLTVCSFGAPIVVMWFGSKRALMLGLSGYWIFILANLIPSWYTLIPASVYSGFSASVLWVAEGTYITFAAKSHAAVCGISEADAIGSFNGQFWSLFNFNQVVGNLLSLALMQFRENSAIQPDKTSAGITELLLVLLGSMAAGTILAYFLRSHKNLVTRASTADASVANRSYAKAFVALMSERRMLFLICFIQYTGMQRAFIWGDFTRDIIVPTLGISWVGGVMAVNAASATVASFVAGRYSSGLLSIAAILVVGACCQFIVMGIVFLEGPFGEDSRQYMTVFGTAILWGIGDATFNTQLNAVLGIFYPHDTEAAFAQLKIWESFATSVVFFASPYMTLTAKILSLFFVLLVAMACFLVVVWRSTRAR